MRPAPTPISTTREVRQKKSITASINRVTRERTVRERALIHCRKTAQGCPEYENPSVRRPNSRIHSHSSAAVTPATIRWISSKSGECWANAIRRTSCHESGLRKKCNTLLSYLYYLYRQQWVILSAQTCSLWIGKLRVWTRLQNRLVGLRAWLIFRESNRRDNKYW